MSEGKKSSKIAIATFIVGLLIGLVAMYAAAPSLITPTTSVTPTTPTTPTGLSGTITIGDLVALTGDLSAYGQHSKNAIDMAISDINAYMNASGSSVRFAVDHEDTATDPATALQKLQTLAASGVQVCIGPMTSAEVTNVLSYANANHIVLISQSSTAQSLAYPNRGYLYRLVPTDDAQSQAVASVVWEYGATNVIVIARHDAWGDGLSSAFEQQYKALGGNIIDTIEYTPITTGTYDFSAQLTKMLSDYNTAVATYGASKVAIVAVSFDELSVIYQQLSSYPALEKAVWFGTDGTATSSTVASTAGAVAAQVKSLSTIYAPTRGSKYAAFTSRYEATYGGVPDAYAYSAYDAAWIAALSILAAGKNDGAAIKAILPSVANNYYGVSGWPDLNANGDRAIADYAVWEVQPVNATAYTWAQVGTWSASSDSVSYTTTP